MRGNFTDAKEAAPEIDIPGFFALHVPAAVLPIVAGALLYGGAAMATLAVVLLSALAALAIWRRVGWRGRQMNRAQCLWMALLLALALPPHLLSFEAATWAILVSAGLLLIAWTWLLGALGSGRVHPVLAAYLTLVILFQPMLTPHYVLTRRHVFLGRLFNAERVDPNAARTVSWFFQPPATGGSDALYATTAAAQRLTAYTSGRYAPDRSSVSVQMLLRDQMPPLEDFILGGEPGPIGLSSALAVILGGLFLLHRGLIDWRIPLLAAAAALAGFLILPIPVVITDVGAQWRWLAFLPHNLDWPAALTLANYELLASPLLFVAFFLATAPQSRPMSPRGRAVYAVLFGLLAAGAQLYVSVSVGPYVALLLASLGSRVVDRLFSPKTAWAVYRSDLGHPNLTPPGAPLPAGLK